MIHIHSRSALEKIFPDAEDFRTEYGRGSSLRGESFAWQAAIKWDGWGTKPLRVQVDSPLKEHIRLYRVGNVPCELPAYPARHDSDYLSVKPGLFPDPLFPLSGALEANSFTQTVVWVDILVPEDCSPGEYPVTLLAEGGGESAQCTFTLEVIGASLPKQKLIYTQWLHGDCLAQWYGVPVYSEEYWSLLGRYLRAAAEEGMNMVLTPVLTPALDTEVGAERPRTQLANIRKTKNTYTFDFSNLGRFIRVAQEAGMEYFEVSHLFTQWGAGFAPAIYVVENGSTLRLFGWDTPASSPAYREFLAQFLPALTGYFRRTGLEGKVVFHISDEPEEKDLEAYKKARESVLPYLDGFPLYDALSDTAFFDKGLVSNPIAATNHIEGFLQREAPGLWAYTCCSQNVDVANRFLAMPSYRNRILGWQLYKFKIAGFLHWGLNFWNSQNSRSRIDPYTVTDAGRAFPGGDPFSVYPGPDGPIKSLRMKVFHHALQDMRALELLESLRGPEAVQALPGFGGMTFSTYPRSPGSLLAWRETVNGEIAKHMAEKEQADG